MRFSPIALSLAMALFPIGTVSAQDQPASAKPQQQLLDAAQLDQLVAPIALYADPLVAQVLMASTYPLEVVQADRFAKANKKLKGDKLKEALAKQDWDASVKELVSTPSVLAMMGDKLDWTQTLGDAVLAQQADVMDAIQRLRAKAQENGKLETTKQQTVTVRQEADQQVIEIEPASPDVVYVPYYDPAVVYGEWPYPEYPPYYYPPPSGYIVGGAIATGLACGVAYAVGREIWDDIDWDHGDINIDVDRNIDIDRNVDIDRNLQMGARFPSQTGREYKNDAVRNKFAKADTRPADRKLDYRGRSGEQVLKPGNKPGGRWNVRALAAIARISVVEDRNKGRRSVKFKRGLRSAQENRRRCKGRSLISARLKQKAGLEVMPLIEVMARKPKISPSAGKQVSVTVGHRSFPGHLAAECRRRSVKVVVEDLSTPAAGGVPRTCQPRRRRPRICQPRWRSRRRWWATWRRAPFRHSPQGRHRPAGASHQWP